MTQCCYTGWLPKALSTLATIVAEFGDNLSPVWTGLKTEISFGPNGRIWVLANFTFSTFLSVVKGFCVFLCVLLIRANLFCVFCVFSVYFRLFVLCCQSVPVQVIAWKDLSPKWPSIYSFTHSRYLYLYFYACVLSQSVCLVEIWTRVCIVRVANVHGPRGGSLASNAGVRGLALLDGLLYVLQVGRSSTDIAVHDTSLSLKRLPVVARRLAVPGLRDASDLAACGRYRCLYVTDVGDDCIHRVNGPEGTLSFQSWPVGDKPWGVSVTSVSHILLLL